MDDLRQVCLKLAGWFWRKRFSSFDNVYSLLCYYLPLEKGGALHLNKLEFSSPKKTLSKGWLKLAPWFWRKTFLKFCQCMFISPWVGGALHLNKLGFLSPKDALYEVWLKLVQWFWRRRRKCEKFQR